jgi:hypothetical protein
MSERLWSPQMRKWAKDADRHGIQIGFARDRRPFGEHWEGGGSAFSLLERFTDDEGPRIIDPPASQSNAIAYRTIDGPYPWAINNAIPVFLLADDGKTQLTSDSGNLSLLAG